MDTMANASDSQVLFDPPAASGDAVPWLPPVLTDALKVRIHDLMVKGRATEEMLIRMMRTGHGYFWIGGPGEEGFNVPLALHLKVGKGPDYDYLHLHYRSSAIVLAMGGEPIDVLRQMRSTATDPYSKGRNFVNHFAIHKWNVVPVTPTIETQYVVAPGTAWVQRRHGGSGLSIVNGGDAGTAEGDFASCFNWSTRPGHELPVLILIAQNHFGISTPAGMVQNTTHLHERARGWNIPSREVDGNDPIASWEAIREAMQYVRTERKPFCLQANVSRLYGHSSSSGAHLHDEPDCVGLYEQRLVRENLMTQAEIKAVRERWQSHLSDALKVVIAEPMPGAEHVQQHVFAPQEG
jgi:2-oxoisovalerate dehydrogenase E1 component alpha subunit